MYPMGLGSTVLPFGGLWFSVTVSVRKRGFLDEGWGLQLPKYKDNYLECSLVLCWFRKLVGVGSPQDP